MPAYMEFTSLVNWKDESGPHAKGEVVQLPYETWEQRADANRLVDYGVVSKRPHTRRSKRKAS
jgi:hypothetical protein